jgi:hypothetical protein
MELLFLQVLIYIVLMLIFMHLVHLGATINDDTVHKLKHQLLLVLQITNWQMKMFTEKFCKKEEFYMLQIS